MSKFLSKTLTISFKQLVISILGTLIVLFATWFGVWISSEWRMKTGGVSAEKSPFYSQIPDECKNYSGRSRGYHTNLSTNESQFDMLSLRYRVHRRPILLQGDPLGLNTKCLGYAVLAGSHAEQPNGANFTEIFTDAKNQKVIEITVKYYQNLPEVIQRDSK